MRANFRDLDILAAGPIVRDASMHFDDYWNSPVAVPVTAFSVRREESVARQELEELREFAEDKHGPHAEYARRKPEFVKRMLAGGADLIWARGEAVAERPIREADPVKGSAVCNPGRSLASVRKGEERS